MAVNEEYRYQKAVEWIHSNMRFGSRLGLERISKLLSLLGNPEKSCKFLHVTGTNGKGSVTAFIASVLREAGYRTGMYTSPYLEDYRERIMINGRKIPKNVLTELVEEVRSRVDQMVAEGYEHPTEFEVNTALGFLYFAREQCDYVALEVGLGGRFDATNVVIPLVSVITTIGYDHTDRLGNTLSEIAFEKAGIIKAGIPVVTGALEDEPFEVIRKRARELSSPLIAVGQNPAATVTWEEVSYSLEGQVINVFGPEFTYTNLRVPLLGRHQQLNASLAIAALHAASATDRDKALILDEKSVRAGIAKTVWPGRLEVLHRNPMVVLDGAHNPQGARALAEAISAIPRKKLICVFGMLADKSYGEATAYIIPQCDEVIVTRPEIPRALDPAVLAIEVEKYCPKVAVEPDIAKALELALTRASGEDLVLCCGSLYLVGPARTLLRERYGIEPYGGE